MYLVCSRRTTPGRGAQRPPQADSRSAPPPPTPHAHAAPHRIGRVAGSGTMHPARPPPAGRRPGGEAVDGEAPACDQHTRTWVRAPPSKPKPLAEVGLGARGDPDARHGAPRGMGSHGSPGPRTRTSTHAAGEGGPEAHPVRERVRIHTHRGGRGAGGSPGPLAHAHPPARADTPTFVEPTCARGSLRRRAETWRL